MQIDITDGSILSSDQSIILTFGEFTNPSDPEIEYSFGVETFYSATDDESRVQYKTSLISKTF